MKNKDNFTQTEYNPFDGPVAGQSLTDEPGNYPWEHAPQYTDPEELLDSMYDQLTSGKMAEQIIAMLDAGVPVEAIVRTMTFSGFMQGKYTPDVGFMIIEPSMKLVSAIGIRAGVSELKLSLFESIKDCIKVFLLSSNSVTFLELRSTYREHTSVVEARYFSFL